jgi:hypothetical protein
VILDKPGYIEYQGTGTSHGTIYSYDTHVPAIFTDGILKESLIKITQIAPTIAQKIKISFPNGTEANVLEEVLKNNLVMAVKAVFFENTAFFF